MAIRDLDFADGFTSAASPNETPVLSGGNETFASDAAYEAKYGSPPADGSSYYNSTSDLVRLYKTSTAAWEDMVDETAVQDMVNKSLQDATNNFVDDADATKQFGFELGGATTSTKTTMTVSQTANRNVTLPDADDTLVGKATTDVLTNKTLDDTATGNVLNVSEGSLDTTGKAAGEVFQADGLGGGSYGALTVGLDHLYHIGNAGLSVSASAGAMTIALKQQDGSTDPTSGAPVNISFRSTTITSGSTSVEQYTAATSDIIPSGATFGWENGEDAHVYVYALYDGTNKELAYSKIPYSEQELHTTVALDAASDGNDLYSTTIRTGAAIRLLGRFDVDAITTAGTWTTPDRVVLNQVQSSSSLDGLGGGGRFQTKILGSDVTTTGAVAALSFNNLTIGKTYRYKVSVLYTVTSVDGTVSIRVTHNGPIILHIERQASGSDFSPNSNTLTADVMFVAVTTTVNLETVAAGVNSYLRGDGTQDQTFAQLEEINNFIETSDFT